MVRGYLPNSPSTAKLLAYLLILSDFLQKCKWKASILGKALSSYGKNWYRPLCRRIFSASWMQFKLITIGGDFVAHFFPTLIALEKKTMLCPQLAIKARVTVFLVRYFQVAQLDRLIKMISELPKLNIIQITLAVGLTPCFRMQGVQTLSSRWLVNIGHRLKFCLVAPRPFMSDRKSKMDAVNSKRKISGEL